MSADAAIAFALAQVGKPYRWGSTGPNSFDCSGLIQAACHAAGVSVGRTTYTQITNGTKVSRAELQPGDLVFPDAGHVQMYIGNGQVVEAPHTGALVRTCPMWGFWQARRVMAPGSGLAGVPAGTDTGAPGWVSHVPLVGGVLSGAAAMTHAAGSVAEHLVSPVWWQHILSGIAGVIVALIAVVYLKRSLG